MFSARSNFAMYLLELNRNICFNIIKKLYFYKKKNLYLNLIFEEYVFYDKVIHNDIYKYISDNKTLFFYRYVVCVCMNVSLSQ